MLKQKFRDDDSGFHHIVAAKDRAEAEVKVGGLRKGDFSLSHIPFSC